MPIGRLLVSKSYLEGGRLFVRFRGNLQRGWHPVVAEPARDDAAWSARKAHRHRKPAVRPYHVFAEAVGVLNVDEDRMVFQRFSGCRHRWGDDHVDVVESVEKILANQGTNLVAADVVFCEQQVTQLGKFRTSIPSSAARSLSHSS